MDKKKADAFIEKIDGKMVAIASDETVDRHGDSLPVDSWDLKSFKKNPVLQFAHDYSTPPVGIAKNIKVENGKLMFEPEFHEFTQLARDVKKLFQEGIMRAFSVGFIPHFDEKGKTEKEKVRLELLEISAVPVPANPTALITEKSIKQDVSDGINEQITEWLEKSFDDTDDTEYKMKSYMDDGTAIIEVKEGKVLSKKTMGVIQRAADALNELLDIEGEKSVDDGRVEIKEYTENKGRSQEVDVKKSLEAINNQLGFIVRKINK